MKTENKKLKVIFYIYDFDDEPLGILYISSALKLLNVEVDIILTKYENYLVKTINFKPDIAAFTVTTGFDKYYLEVAKDLKLLDKKIVTIFGGPHCTFFPEFIENPNVDIICRGESELAVMELISKIQTGENIFDIKNLYLKTDKGIIKNDVRDLVIELDDLPQPDRALLTKYKFYRDGNKKDFITGRGCPFNCTYCFNHIFNKLYKGKGKVIRKHSVDYIITQILNLKKNANIGFIQFVDDIFIIDENWLTEFAEKYKNSIDIPFTCNIRVDYVNEKIIQILKKSGCVSVSMGIEAGDEKVRNKILKRNMTNEQILDACKIIKSAGLKLATQNIVGVPGSNLENDFKTMRLNYLGRTDYAWCTIYQPYPGIELTNLAIELGLFDGSRNSISKSFHEDTILNIPKKLETINLHKLFGLGAEFGYLEYIIKFLIKLKLTRVYSLLRKIWNVYCYKYRIAKNISWKEIYWKAIVKKL